MRKWISLLVAALAFIGCGEATDVQQDNAVHSSAVEQTVAAKAPKLVLIRVKGEVKSMDAVKNGEAVVVDADKEELAVSADAAERLFAAGEPITIAESLQSDDGDESSTQSWRFGWGGWGGRGWGWNNWGWNRGWNNWGWNNWGSLGFGWPSYNFYRPYAFYNPYFYAAPAVAYNPCYAGFYGCGAAAYYTPYAYAGYTYYPYAWW